MVFFKRFIVVTLILLAQEKCENVFVLARRSSTTETKSKKVYSLGGSRKQHGENALVVLKHEERGQDVTVRSENPSIVDQRRPAIVDGILRAWPTFTFGADLWDERMTDDGKKYFANHTTETTQWDDPRLVLSPTTCQDDELMRWIGVS